MNTEAKVDSAKLKKAMILAAGFGTRLKPLTDKIPKALIPYNGKPMIENVIDKLSREGIEDIIINTHYLHEQVQDFFASKDFGVKITLIYEAEILGTGGAIKNAESYLKDSENFLVYNVDVDSNIDIEAMYSYHLEKKPLATLALNTRDTTRPLIVDEDFNIIGNKNSSGEFRYAIPKGNVDFMGFMGIHIISSKIFENIEENGFFDIFKLYFRIIESKADFPNIIGYKTNNIRWKDLGKISEINKKNE